MIKKKTMTGNQDRLVIVEAKQILLDIIKIAIRMYRKNPTEEMEIAIREVKQGYDRIK